MTLSELMAKRESLMVQEEKAYTEAENVRTAVRHKYGVSLKEIGDIAVLTAVHTRLSDQLADLEEQIEAAREENKTVG